MNVAKGLLIVCFFLIFLFVQLDFLTHLNLIVISWNKLNRELREILFFL
jgi:hypothetical protein